MLERLDVIEVLRGLDERNLRIVKVAQRIHQEVRTGHVIGIQHSHELGINDA